MIHNFLARRFAWYDRWHQQSHVHVFHWVIFIMVAISTGTVVTLQVFINNNTLYSGSSQTSSVIMGVAGTLPEIVEDIPAFERLKEISQLTASLLTSVRQYDRVPLAQRADIATTIQLIAQERAVHMKILLEEDPEAFLRTAISPEVRQGLPESIKDFVEEKKKVRGQLELLHVDYFEEDHSEFEMYMSENNVYDRTWRVYTPAHDENSFQTGDQVEIDAYALGSDLVAYESDVQILATTQTTPDVEYKTAVIMFNWQNDTRTSVTADAIRRDVFTASNSVNSYYKESSFGKFGLTGKNRQDGDVFGMVTIPYDNTNCSSNYSNWTNAAENEIKKQGIDLTGYNIKMYVFPAISCGWSGLGSLGGNPARSWINGWRLGTAIHEIGHNINVHHAASYRCTEGGSRVAVSADSSNCVTSEYGDPFSVMGNAGGMKHFHAYAKGQTGTYSPNWLTSNNTLTLDRNKPTSETYTIQPLSTTQSGIQSLRIPRLISSTGTVTEYYYLEYRQPYGFDNFTSSSAVVNGVSIRLAPHYSTRATSRLIDTTPETTAFTDAPLVVGRTFTDVGQGIDITTLAVRPDGVDVRIGFGAPACVQNLPTVSISPANSSITVGGSAIMSVTVKNNDTASCAPVRFTVAGVIDGSALLTPQNFVTELLNPGAIGMYQVVVATDPDTTAQALRLTEVVTHPDLVNTVSVAASITIQTVDLVSPDVTIVTPEDGAQIPTRGSLTINAVASDSSSISQISISFNNKVVKTCRRATSCSVGVNTSKIANGKYVVSVSATDASVNANQATKVIYVYKGVSADMTEVEQQAVGETETALSSENSVVESKQQSEPPVPPVSQTPEIPATRGEVSGKPDGVGRNR